MSFRNLYRKVSWFFCVSNSLLVAADADPPQSPRISILIGGPYGETEIACSYCSYKCLFPPDFIEPHEVQSLREHACSWSKGTCNPFSCKKVFLLRGAMCEMYMADAQYAICFQCFKKKRKFHAIVKPYKDD